ncbi:hypothetical protein WA026_007355 [Henosepilachna vigintioctopunctata]|uniref:MATH domain-containing protein n=1 Tax=Henosepilachna vigintioctopunctata TaxID=420089 RepID=A0AAW1UUJ2_9CUCU
MAKPDFECTFIDTREAILRYTVHGFSKLCGPVVSPPCYLLNLPWRILIMPWAIQDDDKKWTKRYMSYFLQCTMDKKYKNWLCNINGELDLLSVCEENKPFRRLISQEFSSNKDNFGYNCYMLWDDILDPGKGFIKDDAITLQLHFIIEIPSNGSIWYNMNNFTGRISIPKKKKRHSPQERNLVGELREKIRTSDEAEEHLTSLRKLKELFKI